MSDHLNKVEGGPYFAEHLHFITSLFRNYINSFAGVDSTLWREAKSYMENIYLGLATLYPPTRSIESVETPNVSISKASREGYERIETSQISKIFQI